MFFYIKWHAWSTLKIYDHPPSIYAIHCTQGNVMGKIFQAKSITESVALYLIHNKLICDKLWQLTLSKSSSIMPNFISILHSYIKMEKCTVQHPSSCTSKTSFMCHISFNSITNQTNQINPIFLLKQIITKHNIRELYVSIWEYPTQFRI
jgi:hypothetical protein